MTRNKYFRMSPATYEELLSFIAPKTPVARNVPFHCLCYRCGIFPALFRPSHRLLILHPCCCLNHCVVFCRALPFPCLHVKRRQRFVVKRVFLSCSLVGFVSAVFNCCSDWFILQGEKIRSEKVGMVSTFSQRIIRCEFSNLHFCAYFSRIRGEKFASHEKIRLV